MHDLFRTQPNVPYPPVSSRGFLVLLFNFDEYLIGMQSSLVR
nr:MAG TPA: hypothetical protein [Caudoviricetes sp.]